MPRTIDGSSVHLFNSSIFYGRAGVPADIDLPESVHSLCETLTEGITLHLCALPRRGVFILTAVTIYVFYSKKKILAVIRGVKGELK